jgi:hypothetical protein
MTDRHAAFVVVLEQDLREDDAAAIRRALEMVKGVAAVRPVLAEPLAEEAERIRRDLAWGKALGHLAVNGPDERRGGRALRPDGQDLRGVRLTRSGGYSRLGRPGDGCSRSRCGSATADGPQRTASVPSSARLRREGPDRAEEPRLERGRGRLPGDAPAR